MKIPNLLHTIADAVETARAQLTRAETSLRTAKDESRAAKRRRKEAKDAARRAKKQLRRAKKAVAEARRAVAEAEQNRGREADEPVRVMRQVKTRAIKRAPSKTRKKTVKSGKSSFVEPPAPEPEPTADLKTPAELLAESPPAESIPEPASVAS
jgi:uncharacterized protein (DUF3084 family)